MELTIFPAIGDKIKLKDYNGWLDYQEHVDQVGTIIHMNTKFNTSLPITIQWDDTKQSCVSPTNIQVLNKDGWDI
jgi:hypothetical protein